MYIEHTFNCPIFPQFESFLLARSEGEIILGDHNETTRVKVGDDLIQECKVNAEQYRSVTIRVGISVLTCLFVFFLNESNRAAGPVWSNNEIH